MKKIFVKRMFGMMRRAAWPVVLLIGLCCLGGPALGSVVGQRPLLVILVEYSDTTFTIPQFRSHFAARIFGPADPCITNYFSETSHGAFTYVAATAGETDGTADGLIYVKMQFSKDAIPEDGALYRRMVLQAADPFFNYALYDANGDGDIDDSELTVLVIHATGGETGKTAAADAVATSDKVRIPGLTVPVISDLAPNYILYHELSHAVEYSGATLQDRYNLRDGLRQTARMWEVDGAGTITPRRGKTSEIALELAATGFGGAVNVVAYRDQNGQLSLAAYDLTPETGPLVGPIARAGVASDLSVTQLTVLRAVTACRLADGRLRLIVWDMNFDWEFSRRGDFTVGNASDIEVVAVSSSRVVVAFRSDEGRLKLIAFDVRRNGSLVRRGSYVGGEAEEINILSLSSSRVVTALRTAEKTLKVICFDLSADGEFTRRGDYEAGGATDIDLTQISLRRVATSLRQESGNIEVIIFNVDGQGVVTRLGFWEGDPVCDKNIQCTGRSEPIPSDFTSRTSIVGGLSFRRLAVAWIDPHKFMQIRTLAYTEDGMTLTAVGSHATTGTDTYLSTRLLKVAGTVFTTVSQKDGQVWTGNHFGMLGGHTDNNIVHFDPYTKMKLGWLPYTEIGNSTWYSLLPMGSPAAQAVILRVPGHRETEYFILEVRSRDSVYESGLKDEGLAIWHIDEEKVYPHPFASLEWLGGSPETALWSAADTNLKRYSGRTSPAGSRWSDFTLSGIVIRRISEFPGGLSFEVDF
jgi:hypothetical protein